MTTSQEELKAFLHYLKNEPSKFESALLHSIPYTGELNPFFLNEKTTVLNFYYEQVENWKNAGYQTVCENSLKRGYDFVVLFADKNKKATKDNLGVSLQNISPSGKLVVVSHVKMGAKSLPSIFESLGLQVTNQISKHHCKIYELDCSKTEKNGVPVYRKNEHGFYSRAGIYGFDKIDKGSQLLIDTLPDIQSPVADLGCGYGYLSVELLRRNPDSTLYGFDNDMRAVEACRMNLEKQNAQISWWDLRTAPDCPKVKTVVMNPPFHEEKSQDISLGQKFIHTAYEMLSSGGKLYMVANNHLPYEKIIEAKFKKFSSLAVKNGFKILMAEKI